MQKKLVLSLGVLSLLFAACTPVADGGNNAGTGGSSGTGGGGGSGSGTGGSPSGTGGSTPSGTGGGGTGTGGSPAGTGGGTSSTGGAGGTAAGTGGSGADAAPGDTGGNTAGGPAAALHDLVIKVPCPNQTGTAASCGVATDIRAYNKPFMIGGTAGTMYKVKLKICAVYEGRPYTGCMTAPESPRICINGMPGVGGFAPTYPTLGLKVDDTKTYYLNSGTDYADKILKFDYTATFDMKGGSMVSFISDGGNNGNIYTPYEKGAKYECPGVPGFTAGTPFLGQFIHVQVVSVDPMN